MNGILVLGAGGMLGTDIVRELGQRSIPFFAMDRKGCDITDAAACIKLINEVGPSAVINCAAFTDVNGAESAPGEALQINGGGAGNVAEACAAAGTRCVYISTDYVFDGTKSSPYIETDPTNPINAYGRSKLEGERRTLAAAPKSHAVIRSSWLYGANGKNFVSTMRGFAKQRRGVKVVNDQIGAPTYTRDLAKAVIGVTISKLPGVFHVTNAGACSWFEFAQAIFQLSGADRELVEPVTTNKFPSPAKRPASSRLASTRLGIDLSMPDWENALERFVAEEHLS